VAANPYLEHHAVVEAGWVPGRSTPAPVGRRFVGRRVERTLLRYLIREAGNGRPAVAVVTGAAGAGKTALLRWTADAAMAEGADVLRTSGYEASVPLSALRRLLAPLPDVARLVHGRDTPVPPRPIADAAPDELSGRITEAVTSRARRRLVALAIDDVHDLEEASRLVLENVLTALDDAGTHHPLNLFVVLAARDPVEPGGLADRALRLDAARGLPIAGLDETEVFDFVAASGQEPTPSLVDELLTDTAGLPLLLQSEVDRRFRGGPGLATGGPPARGSARVRSIADAVRLRLGRVDRPTQALLQQAAVLGEPWDHEELALVVDRPIADVDAAMDSAVDAKLVVRGRHGVRFAHPLVRSELLERMSEAGLRVLHGSLAGRLRAVYPDGDAPNDELAVRVADHLLRAGVEADPEDVARSALRAGRIAMGWTAWSQASRFLSASVSAVRDRLPAAELATRELEAGIAAYYDHDSEHSERLLTDAASHARDGVDQTVRLTAAMLLARMRGGKPFRPGDHLDVTELEEALAADPDVAIALRVEAEAALAEALIVAGDADRALAIVSSARRTAAAVAPDASLDDALGRVDFAEGIHLQARLDLAGADRCFESSLDHGHRAGNVRTQNLAWSRRALNGLMRGEIGRSREELVAVAQRAAAQGFWGELGFAVAELAFADTLAGRPEALERIEEAHRHWRRTKAPWISVLLSGVVACQMARTRGLGADLAPLTTTDADALPRTSAGMALAAVEAFDVPAVSEAARTAGWRAGFRGPETIHNTAVPVALVDVGDLLGDARLVRSGAAVLERMYKSGVLVTIGWPTTVPRLLAVACRHSGDFGLAREYLDHALGLVQREGLEPERGKVLFESARVAAARGETDEAGSLLASAARGFDGQSMHGWIARCHEAGRELGLPLAAGPHGASQERTIFTDDVVASTATNVRLGNTLYLEQLRVHDRLVRARLKQFRGLEIKHTGDGVNAAFDDPGDAVDCARALAADFEGWNADEPDLALQIRCGIARGRVIASGGDFFGVVQSEAARLCALADPGEMLVTAHVVEGCGAGLEVESLGHRALRGLPSEVEVFRIIA
jgi:class 3 adenylate cyclase/tetratricopeptide (TPR) repeat protein